MSDLLKASTCGLSEGSMEVWDLVPPDAGSLAKLKRVSLRNRSWFSELTLSQRRFMDAVITVVKRIRILLTEWRT